MQTKSEHRNCRAVFSAIIIQMRFKVSNQQKVEPVLEMVEDLVGCINSSQSVLVFQEEIGGVDSPAEQLQASFLDQRAGELVPPVLQGNGWSARRCDCQKQ